MPPRCEGRLGRETAMRASWNAGKAPGNTLAGPGREFALFHVIRCAPGLFVRADGRARGSRGPALRRPSSSITEAVLRTGEPSRTAVAAEPDTACSGFLAEKAVRPGRSVDKRYRVHTT